MKKTSLILFPCLAVFYAFAGASSVAAQSSAGVPSAGAPIPAGAPLTVIAYTVEYPPLVYTVADDSTPRGLSVDLANEAARRAGLRLDMRVLPWTRSYETARHSPNTLIFPLIKNEEREGQFEWIGPVNRVEYIVYRLKSSKVPSVRRLFDVPGSMSMGFVENDAPSAYLRNRVDFVIDPAPTIATAVAKFISGRNDYLVASSTTLAWELRKTGLTMDAVEAQFVLNDVAADGYSYLAAATGTDSFTVTLLRNALDAMLKDGTWERLFRSYTK